MTTITVPRAVLKQALEALEMAAELQEDQQIDFKKYGLRRDKDICVKYKAAITALRAALAQEEQEQEQEPEPGAWRDPATDDIVSVARRAAWETDYGLGGKGRAATYTEPLYARPPRREWRGLTMQEINALPEIGGVMWRMGTAPAVVRAIRAVERALKEKNS